MWQSFDRDSVLVRWGGRLTPLVALVGLAACDDSAAAPFELAFRTDSVQLLAAQDGDGAWQSLLPGADGVARFTVTTGRYGYAYACPSFPSGGAPNHVNFRFDALPPGGDLALCAATLTTEFATLSGDVVSAGETIVFSRATGWHDVLDGTYAVTAPVGLTFDVAAIATAATSRLLIERDITLQADLTMDLDVTADGTDLIAAAPTVTGAGADPIQITSELHSSNGTYVQLHRGEEARLAPPSLVAAGDKLTVAVTRQTPSGSHTLQHQVPATGPMPAFAMPPAPTFTLTRDGASWDRDFDWANFTLSDATTFAGLSFSAGATNDWLEAAGVHALPVIDPTTLPGWDPAWPGIAPGTDVRWNLYFWTGEHDGELEVAGTNGNLTW